MIESRPYKQKYQNLKTEMSINPKNTEIEFGKLIKLPYIRKISTNNQPTISRKSLENKQARTQKHPNRQSELLGQTQLNLLTLQEIQLCNQKTKYTEGFPKINGSNHGLFHRERSFQSLENQQKIRTEKSLTKIELSQNLKEYKLGTVIGRGTYSVVRVGRNRQGKKLAVKTYLKSSLCNQDRYVNLQNQINILKIVKNPFLLQFVQVIQTQDSINIVTELFDNKSLSDWLKAQGLLCLSEQHAKIVLRQLIKALSYLHALDIVHRDIKLDNILINKDLKVKLIDYGFSKQLPRQNFILQDFCGTPHYIAPEVIQREGYFGKPADIWSLGIIMFKMVAGTFPFKGHNQKVLFGKVMKGQIKFPNDLSSDLTTIIQKMLTFDYRKRPTAEQLLRNNWLNT